MSQEPRENQLTIRIPQRVRDAIDARADRDNCTIADVVNAILAESFPIAPAKDKDKGRRG